MTTADLKDKTALVTGSGKKAGIGYGIVRRLAESGANVIIADLVGKEARQNEPLADDMAKMVRLAKDLEKAFKIKAIDVNLHGVFRVSKAIVPLMTAGGGCIVNVASRAAKVPPLFNGAYAVAKAGVVMLTKVMAKELAGAGIRVNAICPGVIQTDFTDWRFKLEADILDSTVEARQAEMLKSIPMGRLGTAAEVADLVAFLASDQSSYITGQAINITGGQLMEI